MRQLKMRRRFHAGLILSLLLFLIAAMPANVHAVSDGSLDLFGDIKGETIIDWWPLFRHDLSHTGYSTSKAVYTNNTIWSYATDEEVVYSSPAVANGIIYIGTGDGFNGYKGKVYALNASTGAFIWSYMTDVWSSPAVAEGKVFIGSWDGKVYALDAFTGAFKWSRTIGIAVLSSPAVANGKVFVGSWGGGPGQLYALDASTGSVIWSRTIGDVDSSPAVADDKVYVGSMGKEVYALDASTGSVIWNYTTDDEIFLSSPTISGNVVYIGSTDGKVYALKTSDGELIWNYTTGGRVSSSPAVANRIVYIGSLDNKVYALNASSGAVIWEYTTGGAVFSSPAVSNDVVYIGSDDGKVYALNASTGAFIWSYITGGPVRSSPTIADGKLFVGSMNKNVYAFGPPLVHDVAVINVEASPTAVMRGELVTINATVVNEGTNAETFNVTAMYGTNAIETKTVTSLDAGASVTLNFTWNTTGVPAGSYLTSAKARTVEGETDTDDNEHGGTIVKVVAAIYIRRDGSIEPATAPIERVGDVFILTSDISESIIIERDNIVVDGAFHTVQGVGEAGLDMSYRSNVTVKNFKVQGFDVGIKLQNSLNSTVFGNTVAKNSRYGVHLKFASYNWIYWNKAIDIGYYGIYLEYSDNNMVDGNVATNNNRTGIRLDFSPYSTISDNVVKYNGLVDPKAVDNFSGIWLYESPNCTISGNTVVRNTRGIGLGGSDNSVVSGNVMLNNDYNFAVYGMFSSDFNITVDTSNIVNGKKIYYIKSSRNVTLDSLNDVATIYIIDSSNVIIKNLILTNNAHGIFLWNTNNSRIENVRTSNNLYGIRAKSSSNITISGNNIANNKYGIFLTSLRNSLVSKNLIANNTESGIYFYSFGNCVFSENDILNNTGKLGIYLLGSDNLLFHNNLVNTPQVLNMGANNWDNGAEGNYWGTVYTGEDLDRNGIGDTPYLLDNYPLMKPWSPIRIFNVTLNEKIYKVSILSNSTIAGLSFNQTAKQISFKTTGPSGSIGFCNVTIPKILLEAQLDQWTIRVNNQTVTPIVDENATHTFIYFAFAHSTQTVTIKGTDPIDNTKPIANAGPDQIVNEDTIVTFDGSASIDNIGIISYIWTFIDETPQTLTGISLTYIFKNPGNYTITLNVTDLRGNWDTDTVTIIVLDVTVPVADPGFDQKVEEDKLVMFDGSGSTDNVDIVNYTWTFIDVSLQTLAGKNPTYIFQTPGIYTITLNVTDAAGNWAIGLVVITVLDMTKPIADARQDRTIFVDSFVTFDARASSDNVGIVSYKWNFGDGTIGENVTTSHKYTNPGTYTVTLTVKDAAGNLATDTVTITVLAVPVWTELWFWTIIVLGGSATLPISYGIKYYRNFQKQRISFEREQRFKMDVENREKKQKEFEDIYGIRIRPAPTWEALMKRVGIKKEGRS